MIIFHIPYLADFFSQSVELQDFFAKQHQKNKMIGHLDF